MARLIDADELKTNCKITGEFMNNFECVSLATLGEIIDKQPTIDPLKHGKWELKHIGVGHYWECSVCHTNPCIYVTKDTKFCPNCGARMDGE